MLQRPPEPKEPPPGLSFQSVVDDPLVAAVAPGDPLLTRTDRTSVPLAELRERPLICLPRGTGIRAMLERACVRDAFQPFQPRIAFEAATPHVLAQLAARGLGVAVLPVGNWSTPRPAATHATDRPTQVARTSRSRLAGHRTRQPRRPDTP